MYSIPMPCPCCCNTGLIHNYYTYGQGNLDLALSSPVLTKKLNCPNWPGIMLHQWETAALKIGSAEMGGGGALFPSRGALFPTLLLGYQLAAFTRATVCVI